MAADRFLTTWCLEPIEDVWEALYDAGRWPEWSPAVAARVAWVEPAARRPSFPDGYGISTDADGVLPWSWALERLRDARSYWICTTSPSGAPRAMPVWGTWSDEGACFGSDPRSRKALNLARDPRVVVHLESGDEVVVVEGRAQPLPDGLFDRIAADFERKYEWRPESGGPGWFLVRPTRAYAWLERDFPNTATRFDFPAG